MLWKIRSARSGSPEFSHPPMLRTLRVSALRLGAAQCAPRTDAVIQALQSCPGRGSEGRAVRSPLAAALAAERGELPAVTFGVAAVARKRVAAAGETSAPGPGRAASCREAAAAPQSGLGGGGGGGGGSTPCEVQPYATFYFFSVRSGLTEVHLRWHDKTQERPSPID